MCPKTFKNLTDVKIGTEITAISILAGSLWDAIVAVYEIIKSKIRLFILMNNCSSTACMVLVELYFLLLMPA